MNYPRELKVNREPSDIDGCGQFFRLYPTFEDKLKELEKQINLRPTTRDEAFKNKNIHDKIQDLKKDYGIKDNDI